MSGSGRKQLDHVLNRNIPNDAPQFDGPSIQHFAFLCHPLFSGEIVVFSGDCRRWLAGLILARLVVEAERDAGIRHALKFTAQCRRRPP
jgi:hypothetical protein